MDRLTSKTSEILSRQRFAVIVLCAVAILSILGYKAVDEGWFDPREPLDLGGQPAFVFFNRYKGCECELEVYQLAEAEIQAWPEAARRGVPLLIVNLDRRPDLGRQFKIVRAPTLLLVDEDGQEVVRQDVIRSENQMFNLLEAERVLQTLLNPEPEGGGHSE